MLASFAFGLMAKFGTKWPEEQWLMAIYVACYFVMTSISQLITWFVEQGRIGKFRPVNKKKQDLSFTCTIHTNKLSNDIEVVLKLKII
eukprot:UN01241